MSYSAFMSVDNTSNACGSVLFTPKRPINISKGPYSVGVPDAVVVDGWSLFVGAMNIKHNHDTCILCQYFGTKHEYCLCIKMYATVEPLNCCTIQRMISATGIYLVQYNLLPVVIALNGLPPFYNQRFGVTSN